MNYEPVLLTPVLHSAIWGGKRLADGYGKASPCAESWELSVRPDSCCEACGVRLDEYMRSCGLEAAALSPFPLLIKFIDAASPLSVQVHPHSDALGGEVKNELWYVVECTPDAEIIYGACDGVSEYELRAAILSGTSLPLLNRRRVHKNDVIFIPAGQIHALGAGIVVAEIQNSSDTTYRVDDYGRLDASGKLRELHKEKASASVLIRNEAEISQLQFSRKNKDSRCITCCDDFYAALYTVSARTPLDAAKYFYTVTCTAGRGVLICGDREYPVCRGNTYFIPGKAPEVVACGMMELLYASV